ncbi:MAG: hypothetical protein ACLSAF_20090 [Intestinimonas sp.]
MEGHVLRYVHADGTGAVTVPHPSAQLPVATLQTFLDRWLGAHAGRIDYHITARMWSAPWPLSRGIWASHPPMGRRRSSPPAHPHDGSCP